MSPARFDFVDQLEPAGQDDRAALEDV